jgi:hypothetical protein
MTHEGVYNLLNSNTANGFRDTLEKGSMNPFAVLEFSKLYKFIVKIVIFHCWSDITKNDQINHQLLCGTF